MTAVARGSRRWRLAVIAGPDPATWRVHNVPMPPAGAGFDSRISADPRLAGGRSGSLRFRAVNGPSPAVAAN